MVLWEIFAFGRAPYPRMGQKEVVDAVVKGFRMEMPEGCPKVCRHHHFSTRIFLIIFLLSLPPTSD